MKRTLFETLELYIPVVVRVHGQENPEIKEVRMLFEQLKEQISQEAEVSQTFEQIRKVTNNYTVPGGVCESYTAVYHMLAEEEKRLVTTSSH